MQPLVWSLEMKTKPARAGRGLFKELTRNVLRLGRSIFFVGLLTLPDDAWDRALQHLVSTGRVIRDFIDRYICGHPISPAHLHRKQGRGCKMLVFVRVLWKGNTICRGFCCGFTHLKAHSR